MADLEFLERFEFDCKLRPTSEILCPHCREWSLALRWTETVQIVNDKGPWEAITCPVCGYAHKRTLDPPLILG